MRTLLFSLLMTLPCLLWAAEAKDAAEPMESTMSVYLVVPQLDGSEKLIEQDHADSGQILEYHLLYSNDKNRPIRFKRVETIVPKGTEYVAGSATADVNALFQVSIDGGKTFEAEPVKRQQDGRTNVVHESAYTHLLWLNQQVIRSRQNWLYRFRVKVK